MTAFKEEDRTGLRRISQAAAEAGVSKQTLQYYLMVGLIRPSRRTTSGQQLFDAQQIGRIRLIKKLNDSGYPLREIREIFLRREQKKDGRKSS